MRRKNEHLLAAAACTFLAASGALFAGWSNEAPKPDPLAVRNAAILPEAAGVSGMFASLEEMGTSFTKDQIKTRHAIDRRLGQIRESGDRRTLRDIETFTRMGFEDAQTGHATAEEVHLLGQAVLETDESLKAFRETVRDRLLGQGVEADLSDRLSTGMIGSELLRYARGRQTPEELIETAPVNEAIKKDLVNDIPEMQGILGKMHSADRDMYFTIKRRSTAEFYGFPSDDSLARDERVTQKAEALLQQRMAKAPPKRPSIRDELH